MKLLVTLVCLFFLLAGCLGQTSQDFANQLADSLAFHATKAPKESVYLKTNKEVFERGEDLWFAATVLARPSLTPSSLSPTLYVALRSDADDESMLQEMYVLENGFADGHLFLSDTLKPGVYWLLAFTDFSVRNAEPIKSARKISIKDRIVPHIFIKTTFEKKSFAADENVSGSVDLTSSDGSEVEGLRTIIEFQNAGEVLDRIRGKSDESGRFKFVSKKTNFPSNTSLVLRVGHDDHEEVYKTHVPLDNGRDIGLSFMPEGGKIIAGISNYVAFKALGSDGKPTTVKKALLLADGEEMEIIQTDHAGMGRFRFFADASKKFQLKVLDPAQNKVFDLPPFSEHGVQMHLREKNPDKLTFSILKTKNVKSDTVHLVVKRRGAAIWVASALLDQNGLLLNVPIEDLPSGIVAVTLHGSEGAILAERLVYLHLSKQLDLNLIANKQQYGTKDSVNLQLKVTDINGNPVQSLFTLSVVDEIYASPFAEKNISSHFLLSDELKGSLFEPSYYFDKGNPRAEAHLDLLMLTQGWRTYEWSFGNLIDLTRTKTAEHVGNVLGQIDLKSLSGASKKAEKLQVQLFGEFGVMLLDSDSLGFFVIPSDALIAAKGSVIGVKVVDDNNAIISFQSLLDRDLAGRSVENLIYDQKRRIKHSKNWEESLGANDDVVELEEVQITANKVTYDTFWGRPLGIHEARPSDYVCQYNILNCGNHRHGATPIAGRVYLNQNGNMVTYNAPSGENRRKISFVKGHYQIPTFYQPDYTANPDERLIPDFRNTLIWEPNLVTDEKGEVEVSFFTSDIRSLFKVTIEGMGVNGQFGVHTFDLKVLD